MRTTILALAVALLTHGLVQADPPARLGIPPGAAPTEAPHSFPISPSVPEGVSIAPPSLIRPPFPGSPGAMPLPSAELPPLPGPGYPSSFPPPTVSGGMMSRKTSVPGAIPPGVLPPGSSVMTIPGSAKTPPGLMPGASLPGASAPGLGMPTGVLPAGTDPRIVGMSHDPNTTIYGTGPCGPIHEAMHGKQLSERPFLENLSVFHGLSTAHEPIDLGINSRFGYRFHLHWGLPVVEDWNLGLHLGFGYNHGNNMQRVFRAGGMGGDIEQMFFTVGLFQRTKRGFNWEFVWDYRADDYYDDFNTSQWRGLISYSVNPFNEIGFWGTLRDRSDFTQIAGVPINVRPINQVNFFWRHTWDMQIVTTLWAGIADQHGKFTPGLPAQGDVHTPFIFGGDLFVPLSDKLAIYGEAQYITPNDSGTVVATLGLAWYPAGRPAAQVRSPFNPLLPTANNSSFSLDAQR